MSEVKLSDERRLNDIMWVDVEGFNEEANWVTDTRPATLEEIMAVHPKCRTCGSNRDFEYGVEWCYVKDDLITHPLTAYCSEYTPKEKV